MTSDNILEAQMDDNRLMMMQHSAITRLRFFSLLKEARSLKQHGVEKFGRFAFLLGFMSGFDDGQFRGFEQGIFHFTPVNNLQEALQCSHKLNAENSEREQSAGAGHIVVESAIRGSK